MTENSEGIAVVNFLINYGTIYFYSNYSSIKFRWTLLSVDVDVDVNLQNVSGSKTSDSVFYDKAILNEFMCLETICLLNPRNVVPTNINETTASV